MRREKMFKLYWTAGKSLASNIELVYNNAKVAAQIAKDLSNLNK